MGVRHKKYVMEGVQFHPESIASEQGRLIFANFLGWNGGLWDDLVITPINLEQTNDKEFLKEQEMKMVGKGIPLHKATKMNSTSRQINVKSTNENESSQSSILQKIFTQRRIDVAQEKLMLGGSMAYMERCFALNIAPNLIDFKKRLQSSINGQGVAILAEIKRASPSKGDIDSLVHAPQQALLYAQGGAAAISVLTESKWFKGTIEDLRNIRLAVESVADRPAILRKEFIFDPYQILQARLAGTQCTFLLNSFFD
jgi:anthranilate synthase/indole-3-glycerol phosphate synthase/phosphoribosylanthranilate isomerase